MVLWENGFSKLACRLTEAFFGTLSIYRLQYSNAQLKSHTPDTDTILSVIQKQSAISARVINRHDTSTFACRCISRGGKVWSGTRRPEDDGHRGGSSRAKHTNRWSSDSWALLQHITWEIFQDRQKWITWWWFLAINKQYHVLNSQPRPYMLCFCTHTCICTM